MIELQKLNKFFGEHLVLSDINLKVSAGEVLSIIGPSGSGKSTLIRCINYLDIPDSGAIYIDGHKMTLKNQNKVRKNIGMVFQNFNLFPHFTVLENITFAPINILKKKKHEAIKEASNLLKKVGLNGIEDKYPNALSGGQKQRVAIARSLAMQPKIMLFDEPTSSLDPEMIKEVLDVIAGLAHKGITMIIVTHELDFAKRVSDRIAFIDHGKILEVNKPEKFFKDPATQRAKDFLSKVL